MITYLARLTSERDSLTQAATDLANKASGEDRDLTDTEQTSMRQWQTRCAEIDTQLEEYGRQAESQRAYARLRSELDRPAEPPPARSERRLAAVPDSGSWADLFLESDAFKSYNGGGTSGRVMVPLGLETRAEISSGGWPGTIPPLAFTPAPYSYATPLMSVVGHVTTSSNAVEWVRWSPTPVAAAPVVPEGTAKPEMAVTPTPESAPLDTYAHWKGITRQALEDIPQIRSIVEGMLRQGIQVALEEAVGDKLAADTDIPPASVAAGGSLLEAIRVGVGVVQSAGYSSPNAVLLNPADFAAIDIGIMGGTLGGPAMNGTYWGLRPIAVPSLAAGTAYVGDFSQGVTIFDKGQTALFMTDSHADFFVKNIILLLAEIRALIAVTAPAAIAECSVAPVA